VLAPLALGAVLAGCAAAIPPVEVTRFHLGQSPNAGSVALQAAPGIASESLEFGAYKAAVARELARLGYAEARGVAAYRATIGYDRTSRTMERRSPITIGVGGGSFGGGVGIGVGTSFGLGAKSRTLVMTRLSVQIRRASDSLVVWEGRAETEAPENAPAAQPGLAADKLARALFQGFPGESGRTITVK
jgi:hypothetical protein